eukprot:1189549-Prorocentrum_minimum.AAC.4
MHDFQNDIGAEALWASSLDQTSPDGLASALDGLASALDGLASALDGLASALDGLASALDGLESALDGLESALDGLESALDVLEFAGEGGELGGAGAQRVPGPGGRGPARAGFPDQAHHKRGSAVQPGGGLPQPGRRRLPIPAPGGGEPAGKPGASARRENQTSRVGIEAFRQGSLGGTQQKSPPRRIRKETPSPGLRGKKTQLRNPRDRFLFGSSAAGTFVAYPLKTPDFVMIETRGASALREKEKSRVGIEAFRDGFYFIRNVFFAVPKRWRTYEPGVPPLIGGFVATPYANDKDFIIIT